MLLMVSLPQYAVTLNAPPTYTVSANDDAVPDEIKAIASSVEAELYNLKLSGNDSDKAFVEAFLALAGSDNAAVKTVEELAKAVKERSIQIDRERMEQLDRTAEARAPFVPMSDEELKAEFSNYARSNGAHIYENEVKTDNGFVVLREDQHEKLFAALNRLPAAVLNQIWKHEYAGSRHRSHRVSGIYGGYLKIGNAMKINADFRKTNVRGVIDQEAEEKLAGNGATPDDIKTVKMLDFACHLFSMPIPLRVCRYVDASALGIIFGEEIAGETLQEKLASIRKSQRALQPDPAYMSVSTVEEKNYYSYQYGVKMEIEVLPGTPMFLTDNFMESEIVFARSTRLKYIDSYIKTEKTIKGDIEHLIIRCRVR